MTILITGGAGFIGSNFAINWVANSEETIVNIDKLTYAGNFENLSGIIDNEKHIFIQGDITDRGIIDQILRDYRPRAVINFAAESHVDRSIHNPDIFINTNIIGTFTILESIRAFLSSESHENKEMFRFIHVSTDEVYGSLSDKSSRFTETSRYDPSSPYSASKAASDHLAKAWYHTYNIPVIVTNCSNNYGPFQFPEKLIPLTIVNALAQKPLPIYGDGLQVRDWLYVEDHCRAIQQVLSKGKIGETYNIGGNNERANIDVVKTICSILDEISPRSDRLSYSTQIKHITDRPGHDRRYGIDPEKMESQLGWQSAESFETGIRKTIQWYLDHPTWLEHVQNGSYLTWIDQHYK